MRGQYGDFLGARTWNPNTEEQKENRTDKLSECFSLKLKTTMIRCLFNTCVHMYYRPLISHHTHVKTAHHRNSDIHSDVTYYTHAAGLSETVSDDTLAHVLPLNLCYRQ